MRFDMNLGETAFLLIKEGRKDIELRVNDHKRQKIQVSDLIFFHSLENEYDVIKCQVKAIHHFNDFKQLYENLPLDRCGYEDIASASYKDMYEYYSEEKIREFGVIGIEIEKLDDLYLVDGHMHLEYGPLSVEYVKEFADEAIRKGLDEIDILDHTHRFKEFEGCYQHLKQYDQQAEWLKQPTKFCNTLDDYYELIEKVKKMDFPIKIKFGLEVCYTSNTEDLLRKILKDVKLDFLTGAIHSVNSILYDMSFSKDLLWDRYDKNDIYKMYYDEALSCARSSLFDRFAHPDQIKMFNIYPDYDLTETFNNLSQELNNQNMYAENNTGCHYRYGHEDIGISDQLLKIFKNNNVKLICASDAHKPAHVGSFILEATKRNRGIF